MATRVLAPMIRRSHLNLPALDPASLIPGRLGNNKRLCVQQLMSSVFHQGEGWMGLLVTERQRGERRESPTVRVSSSPSFALFSVMPLSCKLAFTQQLLLRSELRNIYLEVRDKPHVEAKVFATFIHTLLLSHLPLSAKGWGVAIPDLT